MVIVGHLVVPAIPFSEKFWQPAIEWHLVIWIPVTAFLTFWFLPRIKGLIVGWMIYLGLRGDEFQ